MAFQVPRRVHVRLLAHGVLRPHRCLYGEFCRRCTSPGIFAAVQAVLVAGHGRESFCGTVVVPLLGRDGILDCVYQAQSPESTGTACRGRGDSLITRRVATYCRLVVVAKLLLIIDVALYIGFNI